MNTCWEALLVVNVGLTAVVLVLLILLLRKTPRAAQSAFVAHLAERVECNKQMQEALRETIETKLQQIRTDTDAQLKEIWGILDEKLCCMLETRVESLKLLDERIKHVEQGLGEVQNLARDRQHGS